MTTWLLADYGLASSFDQILVLPSFGVRESFLKVKTGSGFIDYFYGLIVDMPLLLVED